MRQPDATRMRRGDLIQYGIVLGATIFLVGVLASGYLLAQSQDYINATLTERVTNVALRLDRVENFVTALILALIADLITHVMQIRSNRIVRDRRTASDE